MASISKLFFYVLDWRNQKVTESDGYIYIIVYTKYL